MQASTTLVQEWTQQASDDAWKREQASQSNAMIKQSESPQTFLVKDLAATIESHEPERPSL